MTEKATHIVLTYPSQDSEILFRACDGVMIAERQKTTLIFGENPAASAGDATKKQSRIFLEGGVINHNGTEYPWNHFGSRYMRERVARRDLNNWGDAGLLNPTEVVLDVRCQEGGVILAPDSLDMRMNGGGMNAVNMNKIGRKHN